MDPGEQVNLAKRRPILAGYLRTLGYLEQTMGLATWNRRAVTKVGRVGLLVLSVALSGLCGCDREPLAPNVILISLDTLRADHLPFHGYSRDTAPALAAFARTGAIFDTAYSQGSSTIPTHASIFTGRLPLQHAMFVYGDVLSRNELTLAEHLAENDYRTFALTSSLRFALGSGYEQGFDVYETYHHLEKNERGAAVTTRFAELASVEPDRPYFALLHFFDAHADYSPPAAYRKLWHPGVEELPPEHTADYLSEHRASDKQVPPEMIEYLIALYDGGIRYLDHHLGRLFGLHEGMPAARPTLWVVTGDHGEEFKEHGVFLHSAYLHEEMLRVPLIFAMPGTIPHGVRISTPIQSIDLFPTIVDLLGLPMPEGPVGRSFASVLRWEEEAPGGDSISPLPAVRDLVVVESKWRWGVIATLRTGRFKLVGGEGQGLYDLGADPWAYRDVSRRHPREYALLARVATELGLPRAVQARNRPTTKPRRAPDPEMVEKLRALGYLEEAEELEDAGVHP
jgi:arylsulfatase A-like enzyme